MKGLDDVSVLKSIKNDFQRTKPVKMVNFCSYLLCYKSKANKIMLKSQSSLAKELDFQKFIVRQRLQTNAILGLLSGC